MSKSPRRPPEVIDAETVTENLPVVPHVQSNREVTRKFAPAGVHNPLDMSPGTFRKALERRAENRKALIAWVRGNLVDGVDFGAVPLRRGGFSKPSLRKPGAEKICGMLGVVVDFPNLPEYEKAALEGHEFDQIIVRCHLLTPDGTIVADGIGARQVSQDYGDVNKSMKMALKSAHIDATLRMAGLSEIFTQDIEDMPQGNIGGNDEPAGRRESQRKAQSTPSDTVPSGKFAGKKWEAIANDYLEWVTKNVSADSQLAIGAAAELKRRGIGQQEEFNDEIPYGETPQDPQAQQHAYRAITAAQAKLLRTRLDQAGIPEMDFCERYKISDINALPFDTMNIALHWISGMSA